MRKKSTNAGFSLIDLTIYGALLGILLVILSEFFVTIISSQRTNSAQSALEQDASYLLTRLRYDVRRSREVTVPVFGSTTDALSIVIDEGGSDVTYMYTLTNGDIYLTVGSVSEKLNSQETQITQFSITATGNSGVVTGAKDEVDIALTVAPRGTPSGVSERSYETHLVVR